MAQLISKPSRAKASNKKASSSFEKKWETLKAIFYELGGVAFVLGSLFYFPALSDLNIFGQVLFLIGSCMFSFVTVDDLINVLKYQRNSKNPADYIEIFISVFYAAGSIFLLSGNITGLFQTSLQNIKAWFFIFGSSFYIIGIFLNFFEIIKAPSLILLQLFNLTLIFFILGAVLFLTASIPFLWNLSGSVENKFKILSAAEYLAGSLFFLFGGMLIAHRKSIRNKILSYRFTMHLENRFINEIKREIKEKGNLSQYKPPED